MVLANQTGPGSDQSTFREAALMQTLLNLAIPRTVRYKGHARRADRTYGVVVHTATGFRTLTITSPMLALAQEGIVVEKDRVSRFYSNSIDWLNLRTVTSSTTLHKQESECRTYVACQISSVCHAIQGIGD